ncbi:MAG: MutS-related protein [Steroidobacteraceae bacterium]
MKAHLMYRDKDVDLAAKAARGTADLTQDLALESVFAAMSAEDAYLRDVVQRVVPFSLQDPEAIRYRQQVLADCIAQPRIVRRIYAVAVSAIERERRIWGFSTRHPEALLHRSVEALGIFRDHLRELRGIADSDHGAFHSEGFRVLFDMLARELDDAYLASIAEHLQQIKFRKGLLMSARLGKGNLGAQYHIRKPLDARSLRERLEGWAQQLLGGDASTYVYELDDRDEAGSAALQELRERGIAPVAAALIASTTHILDFLKMLRAELAFYIGCLNLRERLTAKSEPVCFPDPLPGGECLVEARGLYDLSLSLNMQARVVGNDLSAQRERLVMLTGANRGGKTTFLRGIGLAQLLMQCGAFVPAEHYRAGVCSALFTHFKRQEDAAMRSGKLDEELSRMSTIVDGLRWGAMVLLNESFASTNEREGSEIARQIVRALLERGVKVIYVTHLYDLAEGFYRAPPGPVVFLRAERLSDGRRTFKVLEGEPLSTSFGADVYARVFESDPHSQHESRHYPEVSGAPPT